ncbi:unnamed protein product [Brachionus calyciflorus]|uniref:Uncharacterized protein n=1 Tax=Brachionus calyciflorus TaxID=104777 RepID=A0A813WU47_9BILA|nr:unnamed protein product [Brachionus calyciflorus]
MSDDKIRDDLLKRIHSYLNLKDNTKYLIYFLLTNDSKVKNVCHLTMMVTNGEQVWNCLINEEFYDRIKHQIDSYQPLSEFLNNLSTCLKLEQFELNKLVQNDQDAEDNLEFKMSNKTFKFVLNTSKSNQKDIKNLLFQIYDKFSKLEIENSKLSNRIDLGESSSQNNKSQKLSENRSADNLKKFNITNNSPAHGRKHGMSILNTLTKRKKAPNGVKFDEDEDDVESSESSQNSK